MNAKTKMKIPGWLLAVGMLAQLPSSAMARTDLLWEPIEWQYENDAWEGNPFDLVAKAEFRHEDGEQRINTELYYAGGNVWVLRFAGTAPGKWSFTTESSDPDLDGHRGDVTIEPNPGAAGFMTAYGNKWGRLGLNEAFVPQIVSYCSPIDYYQNPGKIDADLKIWFEQHGFNGLHTFVSMAWFDIEKGRDGYKAILSDDPNPDLRTFQALELLITKTHRAGGMVHVWVWGDEQRNMTTVRWGVNGKVDQRLQRYICARLGPLPGWSMGYEEINQKEPHMVGLAPIHARPPGMAPFPRSTGSRPRTDLRRSRLLILPAAPAHLRHLRRGD